MPCLTERPLAPAHLIPEPRVATAAGALARGLPDLTSVVAGAPGLPSTQLPARSPAAMALSVPSSKPNTFLLPQAGLFPKSPVTSWYKVAVYVVGFSNHLIKD